MDADKVAQLKAHARAIAALLYEETAVERNLVKPGEPSHYDH